MCVCVCVCGHACVKVCVCAWVSVHVCLLVAAVCGAEEMGEDGCACVWICVCECACVGMRARLPVCGRSLRGRRHECGRVCVRVWVCVFACMCTRACVLALQHTTPLTLERVRRDGTRRRRRRRWDARTVGVTVRTCGDNAASNNRTSHHITHAHTHTHTHTHTHRHTGGIPECPAGIFISHTLSHTHTHTHSLIHTHILTHDLAQPSQQGIPQSLQLVEVGYEVEVLIIRVIGHAPQFVQIQVRSDPDHEQADPPLSSLVRRLQYQVRVWVGGVRALSWCV